MVQYKFTLTRIASIPKVGQGFLIGNEYYTGKADGDSERLACDILGMVYNTASKIIRDEQERKDKGPEKLEISVNFHPAQMLLIEIFQKNGE